MADRYDILLVSEDGGYPLAAAMPKEILRDLSARRIIKPTDEALGKDWVEIYATPGVHAHEFFIKGTAPAEPVFLEFVLRFGDIRSALPFGGDDAWFFIELRGALYEDVRADFFARLGEVMTTRFRAVRRPHESLPPHRESERDAIQDNRRRRLSMMATGQIGTSVEEF
jgi:hypothetical protein